MSLEHLTIIRMADLEKIALQRDRRFLVRLVLALLVGTLAGLFLFARLTSQELSGCAARNFNTVTGPAN